MKTTRLERLKEELEVINSLDCLAFNIKEQAQAYYEHEIKCIEVYGSPNPVYENNNRKFYNIALKAITNV